MDRTNNTKITVNSLACGDQLIIKRRTWKKEPQSQNIPDGFYLQTPQTFLLKTARCVENINRVAQNIL